MHAEGLAHDLAPTPAVSPLAGKGGTLSSFLLLILAITFLVVCRAYAPIALQRWFEPLALKEPAEALCLFAVTFAAMLVHEFGHLLASLILGFEILGGSLGPIQVQTLHGTWKVSFSRHRFFTGSVLAVPRSLKHWRLATIVVVAAGPLATFSTIFLVAGLKPDTHLSLFAQLAFIQVSAIVLILGLIPSASGSKTHNDARLLLDLALGNQGVEEMELNVLLGRQVLAGVRPEDYPPSLIAHMAAWRGRAESQLFFSQALVHWALDSGNFSLANSWDRRALALTEQCSGRLKNAALASSACLDILFRHDSKAACKKFDQVNFSALFPKCFELRTRAAQQLALGNFEAVTPLVIRAQFAIPPGVPAYALERCMLEKLHLQVLPRGMDGQAVEHSSASA